MNKPFGTSPSLIIYSPKVYLLGNMLQAMGMRTFASISWNSEILYRKAIFWLSSSF